VHVAPPIRIQLLALSALLLGGCAGDAAVAPPAGPATLVVTAATTGSGADLDPDGYAVAVDGAAPTRVGVNDSVVTSVPPGDHSVRITGTSSNCADGAGPVRAVAATAGQVSRVVFRVECRIRQVAFTSDRAGTYQVYLMNRDGSGVTRLTTGVNEFAGGWSPDGARLAFTGDVRTDRGTDREVFVIDADGSDPRQLTTSPGSDRGGAWSPDGTRILFTSARDGNDEIYVMNADGSDQRRLTTTPEGEDNPQWSPDGTLIAYTVIRQPAPGQPRFDAYVMAADGSGARPLLSGAFDKRSPAWAPGGSSLLLSRRPGPTQNDADPLDVWSVGLDGAGSRRLAFSPNDALVPRWSPDGTTVSYSRLIGGRYELRLLVPGVSDVRMLPQSTSSDYFALWRP
jgi:Tol biopolymer transport system component